MLTRVIGEAHIGITHEAQYGILVFQQTIMQVVSKRLCDSTTLSFPPSRNFGQFLAALRQNGPIPFSVPSAFGLAQHPGLALVDRVAALAQQACPTVSVGVDDKGEILKEMRPAYLMLAQEGNRSLRYAARSYCLIMSAAFPSSAIWMASIGLYPSSAIVSR